MRHAAAPGSRASVTVPPGIETRPGAVPAASLTAPPPLAAQTRPPSTKTCTGRASASTYNPSQSKSAGGTTEGAAGATGVAVAAGRPDAQAAASTIANVTTMIAPGPR